MDPTYGRASLPYSPAENAFRLDDRFEVFDGKVKLGRNEHVAYQVWWKEGMEVTPTDLVYLHGIMGYGGQFATNAETFMDLGYRIIVPDHLGHGRSSGLHFYVPDFNILTDSAWAAIVDARLQLDGPGPSRRKLFIAGQSLGGLLTGTILSSLRKYGDSTDNPIAGGLALCPLFSVSSNSLPVWPVRILARIISSFLGALPFINGTRGNLSEDPELEEKMALDPQCYHDKMRIATGLGITSITSTMGAVAPRVSRPFCIFHGTGDRITSCKGSESFFNAASSTEKELKLYEG